MGSEDLVIALSGSLSQDALKCRMRNRGSFYAIHESLSSFILRSPQSSGVLCTNRRFEFQKRRQFFDLHARTILIGILPLSFCQQR
jgi:hypothetical protein